MLYRNKKEVHPIQTIALISDIHANLPALEAVYDHAIRHGAQLFLNAGDSVGYGPFPNECLDFMRLRKIVSVKGDYDQKVLEFPKKKNIFIHKKIALKVLAFQWAYEQLSVRNFQYLSDLPDHNELDLEEKKIHLTHGSMLNAKSHLGPQTSQKELLNNQKLAQSDFLVIGNTHIYWKTKVENTTFINPGSVGRQDDRDPRASYVLMTIGKSVRLHHYRILYDTSIVIRAVKRYSLPDEFAYMFGEGVNLDTALLEASKS